MQCFSLKIGSWQVSIRAFFDSPTLTLPEAYLSFQTAPQTEVDWSLQVEYGNLPSIKNRKPLFDTKESWAVFQEGEDLLFSRPSPIVGPTWTILRMKPDRKVILYLRPSGSKTPNEYPIFAHPIDQILFIYWLSFEKALIVHSCGIGVDDFGYAFLGHSGWGKSTLSRLFQNHSLGGQQTLLSDDRLIISKKAVGVVREERQDAPPDFSERGFTPRERTDWRLFGTPWHGDARVYSPASFPLKKIFFLKHGSQNEITPISPATAAAKIFAMSFPVLWNSEKRDHALEVASQIATAIPCYEFAFLPDASAIDFLEKNLL